MHSPRIIAERVERRHDPRLIDQIGDRDATTACPFAVLANDEGCYSSMSFGPTGAAERSLLKWRMENRVSFVAVK